MARKELTKSKALEYKRSTKKRKGEILDRLCEDTGWSRDNARRQLKRYLTVDVKHKPAKKAKPLKYSPRARQVLTNAWALSGTSCGQYFVVQIKDGVLARLCTHGELRDGLRNTGSIVKEDDPVLDEIAQMSSATIDRYLKGAKKALEPLSKSTTKKSNYALKNEIPFGKSYDVHDGPGYLSIDTVAHCGSSLKGEHLWTLNSTDVVYGWSETASIKNKASKWVIEAHEDIFAAYPYPIQGANYDGGSEFINYALVDYSVLYGYLMTRSRPYHSNDNAHVEQRNNDIVRKHAFRYRYEGDKALEVLNKLWYWVNLRKNYLVPIKKCIGHTKTKSGRTRGIYDKPKTPYRRVMDCESITKTKKAELQKIYDNLNDANITRHINELQQTLLCLTQDTELLQYVDEVIEAAQAA